MAQTFYDLLSIPKDANTNQIKSAYHRLLLQSHPDKRIINLEQEQEEHVNIALIKHAYTTLSNPNLRAAYDARLSNEQTDTLLARPRPAQVVSLEEFQEDTDVHDKGEGPWRYPCRCAGWYNISTVLMEQGHHLVACSSCSEVIWVGYEELVDGKG